MTLLPWGRLSLSSARTSPRSRRHPTINAFSGCPVGMTAALLCHHVRGDVDFDPTDTDAIHPRRGGEPNASLSRALRGDDRSHRQALARRWVLYCTLAMKKIPPATTPSPTPKSMAFGLSRSRHIWMTESATWKHLLIGFYHQNVMRAGGDTEGR